MVIGQQNLSMKVGVNSDMKRDKFDKLASFISLARVY